MKIFSFLRNNDDGASAVEFAIVLPLLLIFLFGIIEFGIIMYDKALITNASREGTRFGILFIEPPPTTSAEIDAFKLAVKEKVADKLGTDMNNLNKSRLISFGSSQSIQIDVDFSPSGTKEYLEVKVTYPYNFLLLPELKFGGNILNPLPIQTITTMRMEYQGA